MTTRFKFIHFNEVPNNSDKTTKWLCRNNKTEEILGTVQWYGPWRQYCFLPSPGYELVFSAGCLGDIEGFIARLMEKWRNDR